MGRLKERLRNIEHLVLQRTAVVTGSAPFEVPSAVLRIRVIEMNSDTWQYCEQHDQTSSFLAKRTIGMMIRNALVLLIIRYCIKSLGYRN